MSSLQSEPIISSTPSLEMFGPGGSTSKGDRAEDDKTSNAPLTEDERRAINAPEVWLVSRSIRRLLSVSTLASQQECKGWTDRLKELEDSAKPLTIRSLKHEQKLINDWEGVKTKDEANMKRLKAKDATTVTTRLLQSLKEAITKEDYRENEHNKDLRQVTFAMYLCPHSY